MSLTDSKQAFLEIIEKLYVCLFLPSFSTHKGDPALRNLLVPDERKIISSLRNAADFLKRSTIGAKGVDIKYLHTVADESYEITRGEYRISTRAWMAVASGFEIDELHLSLLEQLLSVYDKEFHIPETRPTLIPKIDLNDYSLTLNRKIPTNTVKSRIDNSRFESVPPYWRWFWVVMPALEKDDAKVYKNPLLEKILAELCVPVFPRVKLSSFNKPVVLPLNNAMRMAILLNRVSPEDDSHDNAVRKIMAVNFVTFGHKNIKVIGTSGSNSGSNPIESLDSKINFIKSYVRREANNVSKLYDKHFQQDHVLGVGVESILDDHADIFASAQINHEPTNIFEAIKRAVTEHDPADDDNGYNGDDDIPLATPDEYLDRQGGIGNSSEALDQQDGEEDENDPNAEISEEEPEGGQDDNVNTAEPQEGEQPQDDPQDDPTADQDPNQQNDQTQPGNPNQDPNDPNTTENREKIDPTFKKLFKGRPVNVTTDSNVSTYMYRLAVANVNRMLQNDPGPAVDRRTKDLLNDWCQEWLWIADLSETQKLLENKGLLRFFKQ